MASNNEDCYWKYAYLAEATKLKYEFHSKRQNELTHLPQLNLALRSMWIFQAETCSKSCED